MSNCSSIFCKNCGGEYILEELGVYKDIGTGAVRYFCGWCGKNEFLTAAEVEGDIFEEMEKKLENGPSQYFPYPEEKKIIRMPDSDFAINHHHEEYNKQLQEEYNDYQERIGGEAMSFNEWKLLSGGR